MLTRRAAKRVQDYLHEKLMEDSKIVWQNGTTSISTSQALFYHYWPPFHANGHFTPKKAYLVSLRTGIGEFKFRVDFDEYELLIELRAPHKAIPDFVLYCFWHANQMGLELWHCPDAGYRAIEPKTCMPHDKYYSLREEMSKLLRRFQISEPAIQGFIKQSAKQLRLALKAQKTNLALPDAPPCRWPDDRFEGENPIRFVKRVYGDLIKYGGMTQADLGALDKKALEALRNYCSYRRARPKRPETSAIIPPGKKNPDHVRSKYGRLTYANSIGAWRRNPTPGNLERKRAYAALQTRKSRLRKRQHDPV